MMIKKCKLPSADETDKLAVSLAKRVFFPMIIYLTGPIGAGKSHFIRKFLQVLGVKATIKSPTYTIVETYHVDERSFSHFDLYRLSDMEELELIGFRELFAYAQCVLVEWPERVKGLPKADITIDLSIFDQGRVASLQSGTNEGEKILTSLEDFEAS